mmetsp:Transcript_5437/g.17428  ORF Transcript_5437/g.17428 Transcript_5437/m.17428 type:complete len:198 (-) Transcript_5437:339-932(-)
MQQSHRKVFGEQRFRELTRPPDEDELARARNGSNSQPASALESIFLANSSSSSSSTSTSLTAAGTSPGCLEGNTPTRTVTTSAFCSSSTSPSPPTAGSPDNLVPGRRADQVPFPHDRISAELARIPPRGPRWPRPHTFDNIVDNGGSLIDLDAIKLDLGAIKLDLDRLLGRDRPDIACGPSSPTFSTSAIWTKHWKL